MPVKNDSNNTAGKAPPRHIAVIMDGNNRWAKARRLPSLAGHRAGVESVRRLVEGCIAQGVGHLTLFAFSSENWQRPPLEVKGLMELFMLALRRESRKLLKNDIRLRIIGDRSRFSPSLQDKIAEAEALTAGCQRLQLNIAANYGGRWDIAQAAARLARDCAEGRLDPDAVDETMLGRYTCLADQPAPDLCIRTAGEHRISNFLLWQMAYTEFYFADCYWPDFGEQQLAEAIRDYCGRQRRFGKTSEQIEAGEGA
ncbi:polyprenyl diphosphate synthase [Marinobacterium aestuariivivens]|uniref:Ditrans,polycis-undecaprenyl-diphosphate synthase ((2E,6E)-farnesyl-diphosphate specific) n=1 Tax=Marinobacterium aestuariivivens TaxID=1698799 RepID=A0ABW1ZXW9_9GAMM